MGGKQAGLKPEGAQAPGRSSRVPRSEREAQMLEAAARLFGQRGYAATAMDDIAAACGISKPMLYAYFKSKEGLYESMINRAGSYLVSAVAGLAGERDPVERLRKALGVLLRFVDRYGDSWRMVFSGRQAGGRNERAIASYREQMLLAAIETLCELRPRDMDGQAARTVVTPYAHALLGAAEAGAQWWVETPGVDLEQARALAEKVLMALVAVVRGELDP